MKRLLLFLFLIACSNQQEGVEVIGDYMHDITSMCVQECEHFYVGNRYIDDSLEGLDGMNDRDIVYVRGTPENVTKQPTIAGPELNMNAKPYIQETLMVERYESIEFPSINIKRAEMTKLLRNEEAIVTLFFENPTKSTLDVEIGLFEGTVEEYEYNGLKPGKNYVKYVIKPGKNIREPNDSFRVIVRSKNNDDSYFTLAGPTVHVRKSIAISDFRLE